MVTGATVPCCDSATALSPVMRARGRGGVDHEDQRLAVALGDVHRRAHRAQVMRAGAGGHQHQVGMGHDPGDGLGDGGRRVHHRDLDAGLPARQRLLPGRAAPP